MPILPIDEAISPEAPRPPRQKRHVKAWVSIGVLLLGAVLVMSVLHVLNTPAEGTINQRQVQNTSQTTKQLTSIHGKTAAFKYPAQLQQVKADNLAAGDIEKYRFNNPARGNWGLAILVKKLPGGSLASDGNYNFRKQNPSRFVEQTSTINGATVSIMSDHSGASNEVAFLIHGTLVAEVSLTGGSGTDTESQAIFNDILKNWHWL